MDLTTLVDGLTDSNTLETLEQGKDNGNTETREKTTDEHTDNRDTGDSVAEEGAVNETGSQDAVSESSSGDERGEYPQPFVDDDGIPRCTCG